MTTLEEGTDAPIRRAAGKWKEGNLVPRSGELRVQRLHEHCLDIAGCYWGSAGACSAKNQDAHRQ